MRSRYVQIHTALPRRGYLPILPSRNAYQIALGVPTWALVEDVEQQEGDDGEAGGAGDQGLVVDDDRGGGAVVGAVVDQVEVAEDAVEDGGDRPHHLVADDR